MDDSYDRIIAAHEFIHEKHKGQIREGSGLPYTSHPIAVSYILASNKTSTRLVDLIIASLLHDTLEDTDTTFEEIREKFGDLVASLVVELTNDVVAIEKMGKLEYHKQKVLVYSNYALYIKLCDRFHNIMDRPRKKMLFNTVELITHLVANRELTLPQLVLSNKILEVCRRKIAALEQAEQPVEEMSAPIAA